LPADVLLVQETVHACAPNGEFARPEIQIQQCASLETRNDVDSTSVARDSYILWSIRAQRSWPH
jgi:hypothetical protein